MRPSRRGDVWTAVAAAGLLAVAGADAAIGSELRLTGTYTIFPLALALVGSRRQVAAVAGLAVVLAIASGWWNDYALSADHVVRTLVVTMAGVLATAGAQARVVAASARAGEAAVQRRLERTLATLAEAVTVTDADGRIHFANPAAAELLEAGSVEELIAAEPGDVARRFLTTKEDGEPIGLDDLPGRQALAGQHPRPLLTRTVSRASGQERWMLTKATLLVDEDGRRLAVNVIEDVTEAKEAELRQRFLAEAGHLLASSLDAEETLARVARLAVPTLADWCGVELPDERGDLHQVAVAHVDPEKVALARSLRERYPADPEAPTGVPAVIRSGRPEIYKQIPDELLAEAAVDEEHLRLIRELGMRSAMIVPMRLGNETLGAITFVAAESGRTFDDDDFAFAQDLALRAATAVQNARLYAQQVRLAHTLQQSLLPDRLADVPGWETGASYRAGERGTDVGGDFYDLVPTDRGFMVVLGDVTGKGVEAAALTALVRHTARTAALFDCSPARVLTLVNQVLREQPQLSPVTVVCALVEQGERGPCVTISSAGHPLPLLKREGAAPERIGEHDVLLGAVDGEHWREAQHTIAVGETLFFYTDGVTDTPGADRRFGDGRLVELVAEAPPSPAALLAHIDETLRDFQRGDVLDDRAMLALRYVGERPASATDGGSLAAAA